MGQDIFQKKKLTHNGGMKMKIKKKVLVDFLTKARMEGEQMIDECILDFDKEVRLKSMMRLAMLV